MKKDKKLFDEDSGILYKSECEQSSSRKQKRPNMTTEKDRLAIELQAVKTQITRLQKIKKQLDARIVAIAPEEWVNNQQHMVSDIIDGDRYSMKVQWRESKEKVTPFHYQKHITPIIGGEKFEGKECYVDRDLILHMVEHTRGDEDMMGLIIPPLPVFE